MADNGISGQLQVQAIAVLSILLWSGGISFLLLKLLDKSLGLRVDSSDETEGLDIALHNEQGYNL
jgi:Amt family ammonium transporter